MKDYFRSKDMNDYIEKIRHRFTDRERAGLIYHHSGLSINERHVELRQIMAETTETDLKVEIQQCITETEQAISRLMEVSENDIFRLEEEHEAEHNVEWYFKDFVSAKKSADLLEGGYCITKLHLFDAALGEDDNSWIGRLWYDSHHKLYSYATSEEDYQERGFCGDYISIPHPFRRGDVVRDITTGYIGILRGWRTEEEWKAFEKNLYERGYGKPDYSDAYLTIEVICNKSSFDHIHVWPGNVEYAHLEDDDNRKMILELAGDLMRGVGSLQAFQMACEGLI